MRTIAILNQKGGAGKTTLTLHLAAAATTEFNTAIIDMDPQASAAVWADRRESREPYVIPGQAARLEAEMKRVREAGGQLLYLDTAPHASSAMLDAARAADLVIVPTQPNILDLDPTLRSIDLVSAAKTPIVVVFNEVPPVGTEVQEVTALMVKKGINVCPHHLTNRKSFARSLIQGLTAAEIEPKDKKAAAEVEQVHRFILDTLNHITPEPELTEQEDADHDQEDPRIRRRA